MSLTQPVICISVFLLLQFLIAVVQAGKLQALPLPSYVGKACKLHDPKLTECVVRTGAPIIKRITEGDPRYRIPKLEPLTISQMRIQQGTSQVGLVMECYDCKLYGLSETQFTAARADMEKRHVEWDFKLDKIMFLGKYKVSGKVLILPITGVGNANITVTGIDFSFFYDFDLERRENGFDYVKLVNISLPYHITGMSIYLENLFNGDKLLGDNMNRFLNENWKEILKEVGPAIADALAEVFKQTMGSMADLVPFQYMFPPD